MTTLTISKSSLPVILLALTTLIGSTYLKSIGFIALPLIFLFIFSFLNRRKIRTSISLKREMKYFYLFIFLFLTTCILSLFSNPSFGSIYVFTQYLICISIFIIFSSSHIKLQPLLNIYKFTLALAIVFLLTGIGGYSNDGHYTFIYENPNSFSSIFSLLLIPLIFIEPKKKLKLLFIFLAILLLYSSKGRTGIIGAFIGVFAALLLSTRKTNLTFYSLLIITTIISSIFSFIYFLVNATTSHIGQSVNQLLFEYTGKNLYSGRERLWLQLFDAIKENLYFGYGLSAHASQFANVPYSSHNQFIQVTLQSGIFSAITLLSAMIMLALFFVARLKNSESITTRRVSLCGFALTIAALIHNNFEIYLLQNNMEISIIFWATLGLLVNQTYQEKDIHVA